MVAPYGGASHLRRGVMDVLDIAINPARGQALAHHAAAAFNGTFYATTATVIPVLFLAIAVQGQTYEDLIKSYAANLRAYRRRMRIIRSSGELTIRKALKGAPKAQYLGLAVALTVFAGIFGELWSLAALYEQRDVYGPPLIFWATVWLVVVAAAGPLRTYTKVAQAVRAEIRQEEREESGAADSPDEPGPPQPEADASPQDPHSLPSGGVPK